jgi:hypothetical protein
MKEHMTVDGFQQLTALLSFRWQLLVLADTCEIDATAVISLTGEPKHFTKEKKAISILFLLDYISVMHK